MSMALLAGFVAAYPMNWWLVAKGPKHGMSTVRDPAAAQDAHEPARSAEPHAEPAKASGQAIGWMATLSVSLFALVYAGAGILKADARPPLQSSMIHALRVVPPA